MVVIAALALMVAGLTGFCRDKWTNGTDKLPLKRRDISQHFVKSVVKLFNRVSRGSPFSVVIICVISVENHHDLRTIYQM